MALHDDLGKFDAGDIRVGPDLTEFGHDIDAKQPDRDPRDHGRERERDEQTTKKAQDDHADPRLISPTALT